MPLPILSPFFHRSDITIPLPKCKSSLSVTDSHSRNTVLRQSRRHSFILIIIPVPAVIPPPGKQLLGQHLRWCLSRPRGRPAWEDLGSIIGGGWSLGAPMIPDFWWGLDEREEARSSELGAVQRLELRLPAPEASVDVDGIEAREQHLAGGQVTAHAHLV